MTPNQALAKRLRIAIKESPRTQREIARISGYNEQYIRKVKNRAAPNPTIMFVSAVAHAAGVDPAWLVGWKRRR